jgi:hypothetical protein
MPNGPQRHPSRDPRPSEWQHEGTGIRLTGGSGGGLYDSPEELTHAKHFWIGEGALEHPDVMAEASHHFEPTQGRLFDPEKMQQDSRVGLGYRALQTGQHEDREKANEFLRQSEIPTSHLQHRVSTATGEDLPPTFYTSHNVKRQSDGGYIARPWSESTAAGWYQGPSTPERGGADIIAHNMEQGRGIETFVHEMGHRQHLGTMKSYDPLTNHPNFTFPDPLKEGVADAYVDRFGGSQSPQVREMSKDVEDTGRKFPSYQYTGYSTDPDRAEARNWTPADRAVYAATRAHASETGENVLYSEGLSHPMEYQKAADRTSNAKIDATLHTLLSAGPHAAQALRQTGLKGEGGDAFRRHRDRQLLHQGQATQESLFTEMKGMTTGKSYGFTPTFEAHPGGDDDFDTFDKNWSADWEKADTAATAAGEVAWPEHMSHNQFGEKPRTVREVGKSLGVSRRDALSRGFQS